MDIITRVPRKFHTYVRIVTSLNVQGDEKTFIEDFRKITKFGNAANNRFIIYPFPRLDSEKNQRKSKSHQYQKHKRPLKCFSNEKYRSYIELLR